MWTENKVFREDLEKLAETNSIPWDAFQGKRILITGATGLIGYTLSSALLYYSKTRNAHIQVVALVRDTERARKKFESQLAEKCELEFVCGTVEKLPKIEGQIDYIVHGACPTASIYYVEKPVETISSVFMGTRNMLELAKEKGSLGFVYLSSMEVYGQVTDRAPRKEEELGYIDLFSVRSGYPESKRLAENLCCAYAGEYGLPATAVRLAQTFGPGVNWDDSRVFAYAARCALAGEDIRLRTSGEKENMYLYTSDAVSAILLLLARGERGRSYNVGNPETYCSVKEMVETAARTLGKGETSVLTNTDRAAAGLYPPESRLKLDIGRLEKLGWKAGIHLPEMFRRMAAGFEK